MHKQHSLFNISMREMLASFVISKPPLGSRVAEKIPGYQTRNQKESTRAVSVFRRIRQVPAQIALTREKAFAPTALFSPFKIVLRIQESASVTEITRGSVSSPPELFRNRNFNWIPEQIVSSPDSLLRRAKEQLDSYTRIRR